MTREIGRQDVGAVTREIAADQTRAALAEQIGGDVLSDGGEELVLIGRLEGHVGAGTFHTARGFGCGVHLLLILENFAIIFFFNQIWDGGRFDLMRRWNVYRHGFNINLFGGLGCDVL